MLHLVWARGQKTVLGAHAQLRMRAHGGYKNVLSTYSTEYAAASKELATKIGATEMELFQR